MFSLYTTLVKNIHSICFDLQQRKPLIISGNDSEVMMDVMGEELSPDADPRRAMLQRAQEVRLLSAQMLQFRAEIQDTRMELLRQSQLQRRLILRLNNNIIRLSNRPALMSVRTFRGQFGATSGQLAHPTQEQTTTTHAPDSLTNTNASTSSRNASQQTTATVAARQPLQSVQNTNESTSSCNASQSGSIVIA